MSYSIKLKEKAKEFRRQGFSLKEVSEKMNIAKSTASVWLTDVELSLAAQNELQKKQILGQYKSALIKREKSKQYKAFLHETALEMVNSVEFPKGVMKIYCALLWWCEGNKSTGDVKFTNSDPTLIQNFLHTFRSSFILDESKFRVLVHVHAYHDDDTQKAFWSHITKVPLKQFHKSYLKLNSGKRKHTNYQGCITVTYYDAKIAKELEAIYNAFTHLLGGVR